MKKKKSLIGIIIAVIVIIFLLATCSKDDSDESTDDQAVVPADDAVVEEPTVPADDTASTDTEWAIYWYLCGSDLESEYGAATTDLSELSQIQIPDNVKIFIQTGGAKAWQNEQVSAEFIERYYYDKTGLHLIEQLPLESMGSETSLSAFLKYGKENFPAKKTGLIIWNHGGGSVAGAAFDDNFGGDSLTLDEMHQAFADNYTLSLEQPPFELIGFDTCLMATVDVAATFSDIGKYLVASQELEPGNGWLYSGWADALAKKPQMDGLELGTVICDTFKAGCEEIGTADSITLSVTDLSKVGNLLAAYNDFGKEALANACIDPAFISQFSRLATTTENYGGNTKEQGYTNMVDLGHLARKSVDTLPETSASVLNALAESVVYKINGPYRQEATGLSCYYSFNGDADDLEKYTQLGAGDAFKYFYAYGLSGELSEEGMAYISEMDYETLQPVETLETQGWDNYPLEVDEEGFATLTLGEKATDILSGIYIQLYYVDTEEGIMLQLGTDNDLTADWENGIFKDNFRGKWGAINGNLAYMEISYEGEDYNTYNVPILLNDESYNLSVIYDFTTSSFTIEGARQSIDESGMADKNLRLLVPGDVITTIHYMMDLNTEETLLTPVPIDTIVVDDQLIFEEVDLGDGIFLEMFEMRDMQGNVVYSDVAQFETLNGEITTSVGMTE